MAGGNGWGLGGLESRRPRRGRPHYTVTNWCCRRACPRAPRVYEIHRSQAGALGSLTRRSVDRHSWERDRMRHHHPWLLTLIVFAIPLHAQQPAQPPVQLSKEVLKYVPVHTPKVILTHVRVIDGTGRAPVDDQNILIEGGKIGAILPGADVAHPPGRRGYRPARLRRDAGDIGDARSPLSRRLDRIWIASGMETSLCWCRR